MSRGSQDEFGRFQLLERIGAGGMGEVFRAEMRGTDGFSRIVVVKRMLRELAEEPDAVASFIDEARIAGRLIHPNIAQVYDFGKVGVRYYLVMEYVEGCDLSRLLGHLGEQHRMLPYGVSVKIGAAVLEALAFAHGLRGANGAPLALVHRDVAPSNVLLGTSGEIKLTDFGIAKTAERLDQTRTGMIKGKYRYMSPEQASGRPLDARSDLFAVGVVLFKLFTGQRPFQGRVSHEVLDNIRRGQYAPPEALNPELPAGFAELLTTALQTRPDDRFQHAREFREALLSQAARTGLAVDAEPLRPLVAETAAAYGAGEAAPTSPMRATRPSKREHSDRFGGSRRDQTDAVEESRRHPTEPAGADTMNGVMPEPTGDLDEPPPPSAPAPLPQPQVASPPAPPDASAGAEGLTGSTAPTPLTQRAVSIHVQTRHVVYGAIGLLTLLAIALLVVIRISSSAPKQHVVRVALRMFPPQAQWFKDHVFKQFGEAHHCKVEVIEFDNTEELARLLANGEADLAKVDIEHAPVLVDLALLQRLSVLGERVDAKAFHHLLGALRPEARRIGTFHTATVDDLFLLPRKLETAILVYRPSMVELAVREMAAQQAALDARLRTLLGHGLPAGFALGRDPATWTSWDLVAAAWVWAHTPIDGQTAPRYALRPAGRVLMESIAAGASEHAPWRVSSAMIEVFFVYAVLRELDVLHADTYSTVDFAKARDMLASRELAAFIEVQIDLSLIIGNDHGLPSHLDIPNDWGVAPLPLLAALDRDTITPILPEQRSEVWGWGWGVPRNSREPELAMRLILDILSHDKHAAELEEFPILAVRNDVSPTWPVAKRVNEVGDAQLQGGRARFVDWPRRAGEIESIGVHIEQAFRDIIIDRHYSSEGHPIDRDVIAARLHKYLDND